MLLPTRIDSKITLRQGISSAQRKKVGAMDGFDSGRFTAAGNGYRDCYESGRGEVGFPIFAILLTLALVFCIALGVGSHSSSMEACPMAATEVCIWGP
jgi:hypothetical protein